MSEATTLTTTLSDEAAGWLSLPTGKDPHLDACAGAVASLITRTDHLDPDNLDAAAHLGAVMLTARLYRRRNSPAGIEAVGDLGASYVSRYDADIARLLRLDAFAAPTVG